MGMVDQERQGLSMTFTLIANNDDDDVNPRTRKKIEKINQDSPKFPDNITTLNNRMVR